jgi:UDP-N-acetylglucosamine acyltransferase
MSNQIHPTVIIEGDVELGINNKILPYTILIGPLKIGDNNIIGPHVVIGSPGQDTRAPRYDTSQSKIQIGNNNIIREFSAIQKPRYADITILMDDIFVMQSVHIPHDAYIESKVVITPMVVVGGITKVLEGANIALGVTMNQRCVLGQYSIVAQGVTMMKNIRPFSRYIPNKPISVNKYAIDKYGFSDCEDEINNYVLHNIQPKNSKLLGLLDKFNEFHVNSKKDMY